MPASSGRAGFATSTILCLLIPLCLALWAARTTPARSKAPLLAVILLMTAGVAVSQTRTLLVAVCLNVLLVLALSGASPACASTGCSSPWRWRSCSLARRAAVQLSSNEAVAGLPAALLERVSSVSQVSRDTALQARLATNRVAVHRWASEWRTVLLGEGLGADFDLYLDDGRTVYRNGSAVVDNAWVTILVKGGIVGVVTLAAVVVGIFTLLLHGARRHADPMLRLVSRCRSVVSRLHLRVDHGHRAVHLSACVDPGGGDVRRTRRRGGGTGGPAAVRPGRRLRRPARAVRGDEALRSTRPGEVLLQHVLGSRLIEAEAGDDGWHLMRSVDQRTQTRSPMNVSRSPMPRDAMTGMPDAMYSANFIGHATRLMGEGARSRSPASAAARMPGTSA